MTILWLIAWLLTSTPAVQANGENGWFIALCICVVIDVLELGG